MNVTRLTFAASLRPYEAVLSGAVSLAIRQVQIDQFPQLSAWCASCETLPDQAVPATCDHQEGPASNHPALPVNGIERLGNVAPSVHKNSLSPFQALPPNLLGAPSGLLNAPSSPLKGLHHNQALRHFTRSAWFGSSATPPNTERWPYQRRAHGTIWDDPYQWLADPSDPAVQEHLEQENAYAEAYLAKTAGLRRKLEQEMKTRLPPDEESPPER